MWPTPYFLPRLVTDLSLVPDSEVMLEVRAGGEEERRNNLCYCFTFKKETTGSISINYTPLQFALLNLEAISRHFQRHVETGYIPILSLKIPRWLFFRLSPRVVASRESPQIASKPFIQVVHWSRPLPVSRLCSVLSSARSCLSSPSALRLRLPRWRK